MTGLQLAALSLRQRPDAGRRSSTAFTGSHRFVLDYLSEEVLARQSEETRGFLLATSVLERLAGPLCDALTGRADGQEMLEALERANLFLVPLDDERRWYRYHHLFADFSAPASARTAPSTSPVCTVGPPPGTRRTGLCPTRCTTPSRPATPTTPSG